MISRSDAELAEILKVDRVTVTRWKNQTRFPKFDEVLKYEEILGLPFECFISREPNLEAIKEKLEMQLRAVKKAIKEKEQESLI
ncbi:MAG: helix-turn-helix transcriptional regulator [Sulfurospirillaceae bacterium]|nr:helix-turn-helix transcriptional regulator [Sulfurospirillaceae bacterium]MDD3462170.1 helix-turn-helix transcriptional regulator [Sulfurospirillaceae bacterium]